MKTGTKFIMRDSIACGRMFREAVYLRQAGKPGDAKVKDLPANAGDTREMWVRSMSQEDPL